MKNFMTVLAALMLSFTLTTTSCQKDTCAERYIALEDMYVRKLNTVDALQLSQSDKAKRRRKITKWYEDSLAELDRDCN